MMQLREAAQVLDAHLQGDNRLFTGVSTDSRTLHKGDLFVALSGERFEGCHFVRAAQERGAVAAMLESSTDEKVFDTELPLIRVKNPRLGLGQLAQYWRRQFSIPLVAITGSNGKTTVKDMLESILNQAVDENEEHIGDHRVVAVPKVLATRGNLNNDIGMPLTLLRLRETHQYAVIEMGMNHEGEIAYLTRLAEPTIAVITNAGAAHIKGLGTVEAVAQAKGEIFSGLGVDGVAVINADDPYAPLWREMAGKRQVIGFGLNEGAEISATYTPDKVNADGTVMQLHLPEGDVDVNLYVPGIHNIRNALAAAAAAVALGADKAIIGSGLSHFKGVSGRLERKRGLHDAVLIDDSYNANPESVRAALAVLSATKGKKILVLGDMGELGESAVELHRKIGEAARMAQLDRLLTLGELSQCASEMFGQGGQHFDDIDELLDTAERLLGADVTLLVKGSRFMKMERVVERLEAKS